jgi:hypothetical protein
MRKEIVLKFQFINVNINDICSCIASTLDIEFTSTPELIGYHYTGLFADSIHLSTDENNLMGVTSVAHFNSGSFADKKAKASWIKLGFKNCKAILISEEIVQIDI